ncbi:hypothetical protein L3Q82_016715 [Scortum barcoo]|uniref:Uncharacterized protein n=1 Tax=Scortum barcoo TaxID=214431 RepID=A0ACB8X7W5_9TELE|nr:hypothetical protein L3Q82_016715 [Scortum barcoo]
MSPCWGGRSLSSCRRLRGTWLEIVGLTSTHSLGSGTQLLERGWTLHYSGVAQGERRLQAGVGLLIAPQLSHPGERGEVASLRLQVGDRSLADVCAHGPNSSTEYLAFLGSLGGVLDSIVLLGDFNTHMGKRHHSLSITNTMFEHKGVHQYMWHRVDSLKLWTQGLWCLSWQGPEPGGGHQKFPAGQASRSPGRSWRQKLGSGRSSVTPWRRTIGRPRRDSGKPSGAPGGGKQFSANTVYSAGGELLTSTEDIVGRWKEILRGSPQSHRHAFH